MKIFINEELLDFNLENEKSLAELLESVQNWLDNEKLFIIDYNIESQIQISQNMSVSDIEVVHLSVGSENNLLTSNMIELIRYIDKIGVIVAAHIQDESSLSKAEAKDLDEGIDFIFEDFISIGKRFTKDKEILESSLEKLREKFEMLDFLSFLEELASIKNLLLSWLKIVEYSEITAEGWLEKEKEILLRLKTTPSELEKAASKFTLGEEVEALNLLHELTEFFAEAIIVLQRTKSCEKECGQLLKFLNEVTTSLFNSDMVTAADILDYDIKDTVESILKIKSVSFN